VTFSGYVSYILIYTVSVAIYIYKLNYALCIYTICSLPMLIYMKKR
jgi:hypothetical protein